MGDLRRMQGRYDEAEPLLVRGLSEARAIFSDASERLPWYLQQVAMLRREQRRLADAETLMRDALDRRRRLLPAGHPDTAQSAHDLAGLLAESGRFDDAVALYRQAIEARRSSFGVNAPEVAVSSIALAGALWKRPDRDPAAVLAMLDEALPILESSGVFPDSRVDGERLRAEVLRASDRRPEAFDALDGAIRLAETLRPNAGSGERERADLWRRRLGLFHTAVVWRVDDGDPAGALASAERARSRVLLDQLEAARIDARAAIDPELRERLETRESNARARQLEARSRLQALAGSSLEPVTRNREIASLREELTSVSTELARVGEELRRAAYASGPGRFAAPSSAEPRALPRALAGKGTALVYLVTSESTLLFIVTATGDVQAHVLRVDADRSRALGVAEGPLTAAAVASIMTDPEHGLRGGLTLPAQTTRGFGVLRDSNPGRAMTEEELYRRLRAVADILLPDAARRAVERSRQLLIVPDGLLQLLPFEALVLGGEPVRPEFALDVWPPVHYAPSAAVLQQLERRRADRTRVPSVLLAVADPVERASTPSARTISAPLLATTGGWASILGQLPPLPGARQEVARASEAWTRMRGARAIQLVGASATESALRSKIAQARVVQLATHGIASEAEASVLAGLVLASGSGTPHDDGLLELHEVYDLPLRADLAILSACSTQVGRNVEGEGVLSLSRAFLAAGADRVASTLWPVEDEDMNALIGAMFDRMAAKGERDGFDYGAALRDAKLVIRNDVSRRHPYHWAGTTIMGLN